jgi:hypothetical protein
VDVERILFTIFWLFGGHSLQKAAICIVHPNKTAIGQNVTLLVIFENHIISITH